ncbi:hypothetical protein BGZ65_006574 [Modicella reniformis]|uniref:Uncharacterized protein n=1 Tax=Modicella reniformis TaxID=1440133 RepID=A0A9P6IJQ7_9FUNG|nr:hypothetical protein BGZ65_006574 [Modicella reniformis]
MVPKRKTLSSDAEVKAGTETRLDNNQLHTSKRARKDQHAEDCEDEECEGCAEGEIELQFDTMPSAMDLFQMAREEASKSSTSESGGSGSRTGGGEISLLAKTLFDKAIEEFEVLEKANAHIKMNDGTEMGKQMMKTKLQHAACVVAVGNYMPSFEMLQEGTRMFEELAGRTEYKNGDVIVGLGIAGISQARDLRRQAMKTWELEDGDDDDDEEPSEERREAATLVEKAEIKLVQQALEHFHAGLNLLKSLPESAFAQESIRAAQELEEYGVSLDLKVNSNLATTIFDQAIQHLKDAQKHMAELVDSNSVALGIWGSCLHSKARIVDNQKQGDGNPATGLVERAIEILVKAEGMQDEQSDAKTLEALGQAYLMSTGLIEDEDLIMERFGDATEKLSRALELDPYNDALRVQVEALQGDDGDDGDEGKGYSEHSDDDYDAQGDEAAEEEEDS